MPNMKELIEAIVATKDMQAKEKFKILAVLAPLMVEIEQQEKSKQFNVPDDAWLAVPHELRVTMLALLGHTYLECIK